MAEGLKGHELIAMTAAQVMDFLDDEYGEGVEIRDVVLCIEVHVPHGHPDCPQDYEEGLTRVHAEPSNSRWTVNYGIVSAALAAVSGSPD